MPGTRKLGRATDSRNAMLRAMVTYLFENGKIETTVTRAKEVRAMAEKMVTLGKSGDLHTKRQIFSYITKEDVAKKVMDVYAPKYADRNGGYTRIIKTGMRRGDAAEMAIIELVSYVVSLPLIVSIISKLSSNLTLMSFIAYNAAPEQLFISSIVLKYEDISAMISSVSFRKDRSLVYKAIL